MARQLLKCFGIIMSAQVFFEHDKRLMVFSSEWGRLAVLAKYALKNSKKFGGRIDPLNVVSMVLNKGKSFYYCTQCDLVQSFLNIRSDINRLMMAFYFIDIVYKSTFLEQPNPVLLELILTSLQALDTGTDIHQVRPQFHTQFLINEGIGSGKGPITDDMFYRHFETYSGHQVNIPCCI